MSKNVRAAGRRCRRSRRLSRLGNAMRRLLMFPLIVVISSLAACATIPTGPSVMSLPGTGKSFEQFRIDDATCRQFAYEQVGGVTAQQAGQDAAVKSAVVGTVLGAAAGAAIGSASGDMGPVRLSAPAADLYSGAPRVAAILRAPTTRLSVATTMHTCSACTRRVTGFLPTGVSHLRHPKRRPAGSLRLLQTIPRLQRRRIIDGWCRILTIPAARIAFRYYNFKSVKPDA
jgi:hypothetical protein